MSIDFVAIVKKHFSAYHWTKFKSWLGSEINILGEVGKSTVIKTSYSSDNCFGNYSRSLFQVTGWLLKAAVVIPDLDSVQKPPWKLGKTPNKFISVELQVNCQLRCCNICTVSELKVTASVI